MKKIGIIIVLVVILLTGCNQIGSITISFETNGANLIEDVIIDSSLDFVLPEDPIKEGYTFMGWYLDNETFAVEYSSLLLTNSLTLYAKWLEEVVIENITISFETNGGNNIEPFQFEVGTSISAPTNTIKEDCEFAGWYSGIDLTEVYEFSVMPVESIILYADWGTVGLEYELINNDTEYSVSKGTAIELTEIQIPNMKDGKLVTFIKDFLDCSNLKNIILPNSINKIGEGAFLNNTALENIIIPDGVTLIDGHTFYNCTNLKNVVIPDSVVSIAKTAFLNSDSLEYEIQNGLKYLNNWLMGVEDTLIIDANLKDTTIGIGYQAFYNCTNLTNINFPDTLKTIGEMAFANCTSLTSIILPDNFENIETFAFSGCTSIRSIFISKKIKEISLDRLPSYVEEITVDSDNEYFTSIDGVLYNKNISELIRYPINKTNTEFIVPKTVINIEGSAFSFCKSLKNIVLQSGIETIGYGAFGHCANLEEINLPNTLVNMGDEVFVYCTNLEEIIIPNSVEYIGAFAFYFCHKLEVYCETDSKPEGWNKLWDLGANPIVWGYTGE